MTRREELILDRESHVLIKTAAQNQLSNLLGRPNKKYEYSNNETKHVAEVQDIKELYSIIKQENEAIRMIDNKLCGRIFVSVKNC